MAPTVSLGGTVILARRDRNQYSPREENGAISKDRLRERVADRTRKTVNRVRIGATSLTALRFLNADRFPQLSFFTYAAVQVLRGANSANGLTLNYGKESATELRKTVNRVWVGTLEPPNA